MIESLSRILTDCHGCCDGDSSLGDVMKRTARFDRSLATVVDSDVIGDVTKRIKDEDDDDTEAS